MANKVAAAEIFLNLQKKMDNYHTHPVLGVHAPERKVLRKWLPQWTPDEEDEVHDLSALHLKQLLSKAAAQHRANRDKAPSADGLLTEAAAGDSVEAPAQSATPRRDPVDYWTEDSVWEMLGKAGDGVRFLSAKWILAQAKQPNRALGRRHELPSRAFVPVTELKRLHKFAEASPLEGGDKRLPIVAYSQDMDMDDGQLLLDQVSRALKKYMPRFARPHGTYHPAVGPLDVGVYVQWSSIDEECNPLEGTVGHAIATLFANRLVTVFLGGEADLEYHANSALYRQLAHLNKRDNDESDPWPMIVHVDSPSAARAIVPVPPPPAAFVEGGELHGGLAYESLDDVDTVEATYRQVCTDVFSQAKQLDYSLSSKQPPGASWGESQMFQLGLLLPMCHNLTELRLGGNLKLTQLTAAIGDIPPPPPNPFARGRPKGSTQYPSLEKLDLYGCRLLHAVPASISRLGNLRTLDLNWCTKIQTLPEGVGELRALRELHMKGCEVLHSLPESLVRLTAPFGGLEVLVLDFCAPAEHRTRLPQHGGHPTPTHPHRMRSPPLIIPEFDLSSAQAAR